MQSDFVDDWACLCNISSSFALCSLNEVAQEAVTCSASIILDSCLTTGFLQRIPCEDSPRRVSRQRSASAAWRPSRSPSSTRWRQVGPLFSSFSALPARGVKPCRHVYERAHELYFFQPGDVDLVGSCQHNSTLYARTVFLNCLPGAPSKTIRPPFSRLRRRRVWSSNLFPLIACIVVLIGSHAEPSVLLSRHPGRRNTFPIFLSRSIALFRAYVCMDTQDI